jgi:hypothetical protein
VLENLKQLTQLQGALLRDYSIGHPQWYAENLVALALKGRIMPTNCRAYDIDSPSHGRVQVKCRVDGTDSSYDHNRTNFGKYPTGAFDWAAIVIFTPSFRIDGARLLTLSNIAPLVRAAGHVKWVDVRNHVAAVDLTKQLREISGEA